MTPKRRSEAERLKDCDYASSFGLTSGYLLKELRARGYAGTFVDVDTAGAFLGFMVDLIGWEGLDGTLLANSSAWWNEPLPIVDLAKELLNRYRPGDAEDIISAGSSYVGACQMICAIFDILRAAVEEVGAENFDDQAFYNAAIKYETSGPLWEGYPRWAFSETKRNLVDDFLVYEFDAELEDLVRLSDWVHIGD